MAEERSAAMTGDRVEARLDRLAEDMAEVKGELRQIDKRLSNVEMAVTDVRRDIRQVLYFVSGAILVPILLELAKRMIR